MINYLERYILLLSVVGAFLGGWYSSYNHYAVKQSRIDLKQANIAIENRDRIIALNNQNISQITNQTIAYKSQIDNIQESYQNQLRINANDKDRINKYNVITNDLLRDVGALRTKIRSMPQNAATSSRIISTDKTISAYDYVQWAAGLRTHDAKCVASFNTLQYIYNQQMILINGFNND